MIVFEELFSLTKGQPIDYFGEKLLLFDSLSAKYKDRFSVTIESTHSKFLQGIGFSENVSIFGERVKRAAIFEHFSIPTEDRNRKRSMLPFTFEVTSFNKKGFITIYNIALVDETLHYGHNGFAMKKEEYGEGWRYRCNDIQPNDDFNDIVFTIKKI